MHTLHGAHASSEEAHKGSLEPGKLADLVLLSDDIARVPVKNLRHLPGRDGRVGRRGRPRAVSV